MNLTLSTAGCARLHAKAREEPPPGWDPKSACQFCPVGSANAGTAMAPMEEAVQSLGRLCTRCQKPSIRRINGKFCPSCYNRDREALVGRNRKGTVPRKILSVLHAATIVVADNSGVSIACLPRVASRIEAIALVCRGSNQPMTFGVPPLGLEQRA